MESAPDYAVGRGLWAGLVGGRLAFRATLLLTNLALLRVWGQDYASYAAAMGESAFLTGIAAMGTEKTALKLVPRDPAAARSFIAGLLALAGALTVISSGILAVRAVRGPPAVALVVMAGVYAIALGANQMLVGMHRSLGRFSVDYRNHAWLALGVVVAAALAIGADSGVTMFLALLVTTVVAADVVLLVSLGVRPSWPRIFPRRGLTVTAGQMAVADLVPTLLISWIFVVMVASDRLDESPALYLTLSASSLLLAGFGYALRIVQPRTSLALLERDEANIWAWLMGWLRPLVPISAGILIVLGWGANVLVDRDTIDRGWATVIVFAACVPLLFVMSSLNYVLENASAGTLRAAATTGLGSLAVGSVAAVAFIPSLGSIGAVLALAAAEVGHGTLLWLWYLRVERAPDGSRLHEIPR